MRLYKLIKYGSAVAGACTIAAGTGLSEKARKPFCVEAKAVQDSPFTDLYMGHGTKWNNNWDGREPESMVKPVSANASDEKIQNNKEEIEKAKPKASRILVLVRHGQYNLDGKEDSERYLTELGKKQADLTGARLHDLYKHYVTSNQDENGNEVKPRVRLVKSSMTRATETGDIIHKHLADIPIESCDLIREGAPCMPEPPIESWTPDPWEFFQEGARIEAGFRKHVHRADASQTETSVDILVCHGNVIRYFVCRALQLDPAAWLRMNVHNGSITVIAVRPSGRVSVSQVGEAGHFPTDMLTFN